MTYSWESMLEREKLTYDDTLGQAMKITDPEEAKAYKEALIQYNIDHHGQSREKAEEVINVNIGYWTGYCDHETADRAMKLFDCAHPIFGKTHPNFEEALAAGAKMAEESESG